MKRDLSTNPCRLVMLTVVCFLILPPIAVASDTTINNVREGLHPDYTRIVFDCSGPPPERIGPAQTGFISLRYAGLAVTPTLEQVSSSLRGGVDRIELLETENEKEIRLSFKTLGARVKPMVLPADTNSGKDYRLVLDIYSEPAAAKVPAVVLAAAPIAAAVPPPVPQPASGGITSAAAAGAVPVVAAATEPIEKKDDVDPTPPADVPAAAGQPTVEQDDAAAAEDADTDPEISPWAVSAEASLILRAADGEGDSAKFEEYRDFTPVSGDVAIDAEKDRDYYLRGKAVGIGQDDQFVGAEGGRYGRRRPNARQR